MRLKRLKIQVLPGIDPGFTFEPPSAGINVVTGPNAIGKSSLERALGYLLRGERKKDPLALSLEAELVSDDATWRVQRNGSQVAWYRNGSAADKPALPGADQAALYRLSVEHLLAGDEHDRDLAQELRNSLRGGFDLDASRIELGTRFAQNDEKKVRDAQQALRKAEEDYDTLERQEREDLPRLNREIEAAGEAQAQLQSLQLGLDLDKAINTTKSCAEQLQAYPPGMDRLRGDESGRLAKLEKKSEELRVRLREQERLLRDAETKLEATGFERSRPDPESLDAMDKCLQQLGQKEADRSSARKELAQAEGSLKQALEPFNGGSKPPVLNIGSLGQAESVATPLIDAKARQKELQLKLDQAGEAPDEPEINKLYEAGSALREWLALTAAESGAQPASTSRITRIAFWLIAAASGLAAVLAAIQQALSVMVAALFTLGVAAWGLFHLRRRSAAGSSVDGAKQRFMRIGLTEPPDWTAAAVHEYLRAEIDRRHSALLLQRERAAQAGSVRTELAKVEAEIKELQARKEEAASQLGFDPEWPSVGPDIFLQHCRQLLDAQNRRARAQGGLDAAARDIAEDVAAIRDFLDQWRRRATPPGQTEEPNDINLLRASFQQLKKRVSDADEARKDMTRYQDDIRKIREDAKANGDEINALFAGCGLDPDADSELDKRLGLLNEWKTKRDALQKAEFDEENIRTRLETRPDIISQVEEGGIAELRSEHHVAGQRAGEHSTLIEQRAELTTRLTVAGKDHRLSQARAALDSARAALQDKREQAWLFGTTEVLLDDVEQTYQAEHVPPTLRRAQDLFKAITHRAFDLQLEKDGRFTALDLRQNARRDLEQLSSGTRMQLLLALRLAWVEAQEQGGETLPLFLDEALTTSDEDRFAVVANSIDRLAETEGRQIFYLSARRHECALWERATGSRPPTIDLAAVRFPKEARPAQDYAVTDLPSLPAPGGQNAETYASAIGVPQLDPRLEPGGAHLLYLLRDDLNLLHQLMDNWRITSLGQLDSLLDSDAASTAITETGLRDRLRQRCGVVRTWTTLWRQGRGRPVDRIALEQAGAVSDTFIDRVADLSEEVKGDAAALVQALRDGRAPRFQSGKIEELERWLADTGYTDHETILTAEERRRQTLQRVTSASNTDPIDVNQVVTWLESALLRQ